MPKVRAKFDCVSVAKGKETKDVNFLAAVEGEENKEWSKWTPSGSLLMSISNDAVASYAFEDGKSYFLDISPAE
jgi:hypothetical protein